MKYKNFIRRKLSLLFAFLIFSVASAAAQTANITLAVDATDAARNMIHVRETISVKAGAYDLFYPKWIPGEHAPTGTLNEMINLFITANGKPIEWRRDDVEMFAFHLTIPDGVTQIEIRFDDAPQPGTIASANLARIKWNRLVLYPAGAKADNVNVTATMKYPANWQYATALTAANEKSNPAQFKQVSLTRLVDSPAIIGRYFKKINLTDVGGAAHEMDIAADSAEALNYKPETLAGWKNLVNQANSMFGAHHYNNYKFLVTLSDVGGDEGLEHHESSEDGVAEKALTDEFLLLDLGGLLGHEFAHSWNGKYRRPTGLATGDYETPMKGEMLWVYEGLTEYLGDVLPTRSGLWTDKIFRDVLAEVGATMDYQSGRRWRPLVDTAIAVQFTYGGERAWRNQRRGADYYYEGELVWLEADVLIRQKSDGKLSLDDFLRKFYGGQNTAPMIKPYDFDELVKTLNDVLPYDWRGFFLERIYQIQKNAPLGGITGGGWKLVYNDTPNVQTQINEARANYVNLSYSIGLLVDGEGGISDINPDLAAAKAGLAPGMKITKIGGEDFSAETLHQAVAATKNNKPLVIEAEYGGVSATYKLNYNGGERYPHLERDAAKIDYLTSIGKPFNLKGFNNNNNDPNGFLFIGAIGRKNPRPEVANAPANVTGVHLSQTEITVNCPADSTPCPETNRTIMIRTDAVDPENDVLVFEYIVSGGKIEGFGAQVVWNLAGVAPGTYTIKVGVDDGCGICGQTITKTITVK